MHKLEKLSLIIVASIFMGCSLPKVAAPSRHLTSSIGGHYQCGANSVEIMTTSLSNKDFNYLNSTFRLSTNYYTSGGCVIEFVEVKW